MPFFISLSSLRGGRRLGSRCRRRPCHGSHDGRRNCRYRRRRADIHRFRRVVASRSLGRGNRRLRCIYGRSNRNRCRRFIRKPDASLQTGTQNKCEQRAGKCNHGAAERTVPLPDLLFLRLCLREYASIHFITALHMKNRSSQALRATPSSRCTKGSRSAVCSAS